MGTQQASSTQAPCSFSLSSLPKPLPCHSLSGKRLLRIHRPCTQPRIQKYPVSFTSAKRMDFSQRDPAKTPSASAKWATAGFRHVRREPSSTKRCAFATGHGTSTPVPKVKMLVKRGSLGRHLALMDPGQDVLRWQPLLRGFLLFVTIFVCL